MLHICAFCQANPWFMSCLRKLRRQKEAVFAVPEQGSVIRNAPQFVVIHPLIVRREGEIICNHLRWGSRRLRAMGFTGTCN